MKQNSSENEPSRDTDDTHDWRSAALGFAEKMGRLGESHGQPRMIGRVLGWLTVCEPPYQSTAELARQLHASTSAINAVIHQLTNGGFLEKVTFPGKRSAYFQIPEDATTRMIREGLPNMRAMRELAEEGLATFSWRPSSSNSRLSNMLEIHAFFERELPRLLARWEKQHEENGNKGAPGT